MDAGWCVGYANLPGVSYYRLSYTFHGVHGEQAHRSFPAAFIDGNGQVFPTVGFQKGELRQTILVRDVRDPLAVGRKAWVEGVMLKKGQLVRLATRRGLYPKVVELVSCASG